MTRFFLSQNITLLLIILTCSFKIVSAQLTVTSNTHLVSSGSNTQIVLQNVSLVNKGTINHSSGNIKFNGTSITSISGNGTLSLYNLELNKTANPVSLSRSISVKIN